MNILFLNSLFLCKFFSAIKVKDLRETFSYTNFFPYFKTIKAYRILKFFEIFMIKNFINLFATKGSLTVLEMLGILEMF